MHHITDRLLSPARLQTTAPQRISKLYPYASRLLLALMPRPFLFFELRKKRMQK